MTPVPVPRPRPLRMRNAVFFGLALLFSACGSDEPPVNVATESEANFGYEVDATAEPETAAAPEPETAASDSDESDSGESNSVESNSGELGPNTSAWAMDAGALPPQQRNGIYAEAPPMTIDPAGTYQATIVTENGQMSFDLFAANAPITVNNFINLATDGFYNDVTFHRVIEDFMAQGGDPTGVGSGGPGYQFVNEYTPGVEFGDRGIIAMANAGLNTNGSQFFITFDRASLPASDYTVFGQLTDGDDALRAIRMRDPDSDPDPGDLITSVVITKTG